MAASTAQPAAVASPPASREQPASSSSYMGLSPDQKAAQLKTQRGTLYAAKMKHNKSGKVPSAVLVAMLDFFLEVYGSFDPRIFPANACPGLPTKKLSPPAVTQRSAAAGVLPDPSLYACGGAQAAATIIIVDLRFTGANPLCAKCGSSNVHVASATLTMGNCLGVNLIIGSEGRPICTCAAI